jgi:hypothetical protein
MNIILKCRRITNPAERIYKIKVNEFRGNTTIQLLIEEIKAS